jgi:hypothetical protein
MIILIKEIANMENENNDRLSKITSEAIDQKILVLESILGAYNKSKHDNKYLFKSFIKKTLQSFSLQTPIKEAAKKFEDGIDNLKLFKKIFPKSKDEQYYLSNLDEAANLLSDAYQNLDEAKKDPKFSKRIKKLGEKHQIQYFENIENSMKLCGDLRKDILNEMLTTKREEINKEMGGKNDLSQKKLRMIVKDFEEWKSKNFVKKKVSEISMIGMHRKRDSSL